MDTLTEPLTRMTRCRQAIDNFVTAPASPRPLAVFRIAIASVLLLQAISIAGSLQDLYGERSIVQWSTLRPVDASTGVLPDATHLTWIAQQLSPLGVCVDDCVRGMFLLYVLSLGCLLIGWRSNLMAVFAWLTHLTMNNSGFATIYGVDQFANICLFYCVWMPVGNALSVDCQSKRLNDKATSQARICLRVLQCHLSIAYVATGIEKSLGPQWWNGEAIWRALNLPELAQFDFTWMASMPWLATAICLGTLVVEIGYPLFIWPTVTRKPMVIAIIGLHMGIALSLGLISFSFLMASMTFSAFFISANAKPEEIAKKETSPLPNTKLAAVV